jgi:hypothetical protein
MVTSLLGARPWVLVVGVVWVLLGLLLFIVGAPILFAAVRAAPTAPSAPSAAASDLGVAVTILVQAALVVVFGALAWAHGWGLAELREGRTNQSVEAALRREARFWTFAACIVLAFIALMGLGLIAAFVLRLGGA